ncbi:DUF1674 domain-containing protein [Bradyrhizobium sp. SSUT18]|uniref:DUF1674 domain-containing protein n=1 Tax=unclassified Bradyrhizobium TaxID=2631580 RepID=UPI002447DE82|nr:MULTISPECIES: DUF1674 domain-containing protein [unclassified Bradyrhizobium]MDH2342651.1 DUF1674 domain-containing protein [Bradyrhizobium sp. SSUT77]MDH2356062.1 DUF1674 domain-containing protein [Bradyrhizobium sp. SSUT112]MDH2399510.1 DUF1674 domain-containing protein [Bradyrhizobium sp. SSUT18]
MSDQPPVPDRKQLTPAAQRALAEAEARRQAAAVQARNDAKDDAKDDASNGGKAAPKELQGPKGPEPTRYGDWERKGIASDF